VTRDSIPVWALRAVWLVQPVTLGPALADGFHDLDGHTFLSVSAWVLWGLGLLATLVPRPVTLTTIRIGGPAAAALSVWTATTVDDTALVAVALGGAFVLGVLSHWPAVADTYVDGASYGDEKRFLLRAPGPVVLALGPLAWALTVAGVVVGPLLLASGDSAVGSAACVAGLPIAAASARALHHLHRRWIVLVPAGFVLHDHLALADPTLLPRDALTSVGPASADTDAHDLTQAARGMALEVRCREPHDLRPASRDGSAEVVVTEAILCAPARPDAVLAEAKRRRLPTA
ncbi:uncharacterized protein METZ01_LOCUS12950, partial [marine metagenome]|jgi:hypothetical protein|tara:strand:- start:822 stop:1688 length:867 start_codon:yes stop_codon:yes gene_type:complete